MAISAVFVDRAKNFQSIILILIFRNRIIGYAPFSELWLFFIASLLLNITPGNDMIYVSSRSISQGSKAGIISALGVFFGCFVHILAAVFGLSLIIARSAYLFNIVKLAGAAYLIYLGIKAWISKPVQAAMGSQSPGLNKWRLFKQRMITNALNPKVAIFFLSFLPQFIDPASHFVRLQLGGLGLWFAAQGTLVLIIVALIFGKTKDLFTRNPRFWQWQEKITGTILLGLGIKVALASKK